MFSSQVGSVANDRTLGTQRLGALRIHFKSTNQAAAKESASTPRDNGSLSAGHAPFRPQSHLLKIRDYFCFHLHFFASPFPSPLVSHATAVIRRPHTFLQTTMHRQSTPPTQGARNPFIHCPLSSQVRSEANPPSLQEN